MDNWQTTFKQTIAAAIERSENIAAIEVGRGALARAGQLCRRHFDGNAVLVFADEAAFAAAGDVAVSALKSAGLTVDSHILPASPRPKPTVALGEDFAGRLERGVVPMALGSGVMNDLVKYAAFRRGVRYFCIATAASMDGYCSGGAPLADKGFKITIPCRPPKAILADLEVIAAAPPRMTACGYGDLAGKVAAGADWLVADALGIEPLDDIAWPLVQDNLRQLLERPEALAGGDIEATARLFAGLNICGLAMEFHGSSRPASGADHQIAHMWEMEELAHRGEPVAHGACVAIGTITVLALYDWLIGQDLTKLDIGTCVDRAPDWDMAVAQIRHHIPEQRIAERAIGEMAEKYIDGEALRSRLCDIKDAWPALRDRLTTSLMRAPDMAHHLKMAGSVYDPSHIGIGPERLKATVYSSRFIRRRYTILDLLAQTGLLDTAVRATVSKEVLDPARRPTMRGN
ncbi:Glycerol-1-phosphate dehydrogenase [NAD(P)] [hydrothermal vent metagenome]|uniref:Glycerol-1-phosphate dehydrogenase [NAD(P)] n=1 Tax=hydrothermal vent metagenome TaxID=652676 RepID=A0A3B0TD22_9ZZZZ